MDYMASGAGTIMTDDDYETLDEIGYQKQKLEVTQFSSSAQTAEPPAPPSPSTVNRMAFMLGWAQKFGNVPVILNIN